MLSIVSANLPAGCACRSSTVAASGTRSLRILGNDSRRRRRPLYNRSHMKVARIHQHGGPEVLVYEDIPEPKIKANQLLIRVRACALNHLDLFVRAGIPGMKFPMPHVLGSDIAGEVVEAGELCERVKPGTRVLLSPGTSCRQCEQCLLGQDNLCRRFTMLGYAIDGGNTELIAVPEYAAIPIPDDLSFE